MAHRSSLTLLIVPALAGAATLLAACQPLPTPPSAATATAAARPTAPPTATATTVATAATASPEPTASPTRLTIPTATPFVFVAEDDDCWGPCKAIRDAPPPVPVGKSQPGSHSGRSTCLSCHKDLADPALPADHVGRMDPACAPCHAPAGSGPAGTPTL